MKNKTDEEGHYFFNLIYLTGFQYVWLFFVIIVMPNIAFGYASAVFLVTIVMAVCNLFKYVQIKELKKEKKE